MVAEEKRLSPKSECALEFAVVEAFISDSKKGDSLRTYEAFRSCVPSSFHDKFLVLRENGGQREAERL